MKKLEELLAGRVDIRLAKLIASREWRLNHLYWITDKQGELRRFRMNYEQRELFNNFHYRNEILKARQLGISTFIALLILDSCLFRPHWNAGIVDKSIVEAQKKLDKIKLAYNMLDFSPPDASAEDKALAKIGKEIKAEVKCTTNNETSMLFSNASKISVGATMRGGTLQMLHVSELAYIANHNPIRAKEIQTGSLEAVTSGRYVIKESTHEGGRSGINYEMVVKAMHNVGRKLSPLDYRFFFFSWWHNPEYELDAEYWTTPPAPTDEHYKELMAERKQLEEYFEELAKGHGIVLSDRKKAWYAAKSRVLGFMVRQEFPSTPEEAFDTMAERSIYAAQLTRLRAAGKLSADFEVDPLAPCYVSWDLGIKDYTSLWLIQVLGNGKFHVLDYYSAHRKEVSHYIGIVRAWEAVYNMRVESNLLPHDADNAQWSGMTFNGMLQRAGFLTSVVPRVSDIWVGIQEVRMLLPSCIFHERCGKPIQVDGDEFPSGLQCMENYQTAPDGANGVLRYQPLHDRFSHGADAFRMFAEAVRAGMVGAYGTRNSREETYDYEERALGTEWLM